MGVMGTEGAFTAAARARELEAQGRSIVHLEIGEPDFDTPMHVREAARRAIAEGHTHYPPFAGVPELREAIAQEAAERKGLAVEARHVFVTVGAKGGMLNAILGLVDPGHEVIVPDPGYPIYASLVRSVGAVPVSVTLRQDRGFRVDPEELGRLVTPRTRLLILNSPANPTGGVLTREDLEGIAALAERHDLLLLSDEIYGRITYEGAEHVSISGLPGMAERTIVIDGFSKAYAMTGWRLGYAIVPDWFAEACGRLIINTVSCASTFAQLGAVAALRGPQDDVAAMVTELRARRDLLVDGLGRLPGIRPLRPDGAFYAFPDVSATGLTDVEFADRMLMDAGVCLLPGTAFGDGGSGHVRLSYATSRAQLDLALERMADSLARL
jgi:aspartate/methionine/tyrosine aminotransferase